MKLFMTEKEFENVSLSTKLFMKAYNNLKIGRQS